MRNSAVRFLWCRVRFLALSSATLVFATLLSPSLQAQFSIPSAPSVPTAPTAPTVPTAPTAPTNPISSQTDALKQDMEAGKKAKQAMKSQPTSFTGTADEVLSKFMDQVVAATNKAAAANNIPAMQ